MYSNITISFEKLSICSVMFHEFDNVMYLFDCQNLSITEIQFKL